MACYRQARRYSIRPTAPNTTLHKNDTAVAEVENRSEMKATETFFYGVTIMNYLEESDHVIIVPHDIGIKSQYYAYVSAKYFVNPF